MIKHPPLNEISAEASLEMTSKIAQTYKIGNCFEHAVISFLYLKKSNVKRIEIIADLKNDHCFVVIDRNPNTSLNEPKKWKKNAVVCDPWAKQYFRALYLPEKREKTHNQRR
jgi:hypothetical protein